MHLRVCKLMGPPGIEAVVDEQTISDSLFVYIDELPVFFINHLVYALDSGGIIDVVHCRDIGLAMIQPVIQFHVIIIRRRRISSVGYDPDK